MVIGIQKCHYKPSLIVFKDFSFLSCELFDVYKIISSRYFAINKLIKLKYSSVLKNGLVWFEVHESINNLKFLGSTLEQER